MATKGKKAGAKKDAAKDAKRPTGRPRVELDPKKIKTLASYGCTTAEIGAVMECSSDTLERHYKTALHEGRNARNANLRVKQFKLAEKSATMAIWLGKQYLGQTDKLPDFGKLSDAELLATAARLFGGDSSSEADEQR